MLYNSNSSFLLFSAYSHIKDGRSIIGLLKKRDCGAKLKILIPIDKNDHRAIVIPGSDPHNHPIPLQAKVPYHARTRYAECVAGVGAIGATPLKVDRGKIAYFINTKFDHLRFTLQHFTPSPF